MASRTRKRQLLDQGNTAEPEQRSGHPGNPNAAPPMRQRHYNELLRGLGIAMAVCRELTEDDEHRAQAMFKDFVVQHYIPVWLAIEAA